MKPAKQTNPRPKRPPPPNPIETAVTAWLRGRGGSSPSSSSPPDPQLVAQAPRRWTVYEPMVLLPAGAFGSAAWAAALRGAGAGADELWRGILLEVEVSRKGGGKKGKGKGEEKEKKERGGGGLTHLAVNEGIPLLAREGGGEGNILRSPSGLRVLYGDFGDGDEEEQFGRALWVSTKQNGILQTWAPRRTMFSRGNIKEKARLLGFHREGESRDDDAWAVDLYAGIGYFAFSYAARGLRVLGWELNPWSAEGLRRGAAANGWTVRVVRGAELARPTAEVLAGAGERIVVFLEDNARAAGRVRELREHAAGLSVDVLHVNCGLLPTSDVSWRGAWDIATGGGSSGGDGGQAWLHLHENVGVSDIEKRRREIEEWFTGLAADQGAAKSARVEHVELVKTYAPGVWHCVFDVCITRSSSIT